MRVLRAVFQGKSALPQSCRREAAAAHSGLTKRLFMQHFREVAEVDLKEAHGRPPRRIHPLSRQAEILMRECWPALGTQHLVVQTLTRSLSLPRRCKVARLLWLHQTMDAQTSRGRRVVEVPRSKQPTGVYRLPLSSRQSMTCTSIHQSLLSVNIDGDGCHLSRTARGEGDCEDVCVALRTKESVGLDCVNQTAKLAATVLHRGCAEPASSL